MEIWPSEGKKSPDGQRQERVTHSRNLRKYDTCPFSRTPFSKYDEEEDIVERLRTPSKMGWDVDEHVFMCQSGVCEKIVFNFTAANRSCQPRSRYPENVISLDDKSRILMRVHFPVFEGRKFSRKDKRGREGVNHEISNLTHVRFMSSL